MKKRVQLTEELTENIKEEAKKITGIENLTLPKAIECIFNSYLKLLGNK